MWMWLLVFILVIAAIVSKLKRSGRFIIMKSHEGTHFQRDKNTEVEHMISCDHCGIYVPDSEAVRRREKVFCSKDHSIKHFSD